VLYRALETRLHGEHSAKLHLGERVGAFDTLVGAEEIADVVLIDQAPIGRTPRSNPVTYIKAFDAIRELFAAQPEAQRRGYTAGHFSFNVPGGRCDVCDGDGTVTVEMQFLADVELPCEECGGTRYKASVLEVRYKGRNIHEVLAMTVKEALRFFAGQHKIVEKLAVLDEVGLGYVRLGQSATTLSGGEAQRVKLATELSKRATGRTFYVLDEPTTGLHFADIHKLLDVLQRLVGLGNTVLTIEHNLDVIKTADYLIDLGPEGGDRGGQIVAAGTPEHVATVAESFTGQYLGPVLADVRAHGLMQPGHRAHMEALERENLAALHELAQSERVAVEV